MEINDDIERIIKYFIGQKEVAVLYVFGSFAKGNKTGESDIDIAILIDEAASKKANFDSMKKKYYAATPGFSLRPVDIVILNTAPPFLKHQVLKTGKILLDRNRKFRVRFTTNAIIEYLDFKPIEDMFLKTVSDRFRRVKIGR